jgi:hypothetical protein
VTQIAAELVPFKEPRGQERGRGRGRVRIPAPWATLFRPSDDGLTSSRNF